MKNNWINIYRSNDPIKSEILKDVLIQNNIPAININQQDSSYLMFGTINLYVRINNKSEAIALIKKNE